MLLKDCALLDEIFSHKDEDGTIRHFNATKMVEFCNHPNLEVVKSAGLVGAEVPCDQQNAEYIRKNRGIEQWKLDRLCEPYLSEPIISVEFEKNLYLTVDGHHRWVRRRELGFDTIKTFIFPLGTWEKFLVTDLPEEFLE